MNDFMRKLLFLPEQASTFATKVDFLHYFVVTVTMVSSLGVGLIATYFFFRYRETKPFASTPIVEPSHKFEAMVIAVPLIFFFAWVWIGFKDYIWYVTPPKNTTDIYVTGKKWMWHFAYPDGPNANATQMFDHNLEIGKALDHCAKLGTEQRGGDAQAGAAIPGRGDD